MDAKAENRARLERLGIVVDEQGNFVQAEAPVAPAPGAAPAAEPAAPAPGEEAGVPPAPPAPVIPPAEPPAPSAAPAPLQDDLETRERRAKDREEAAKAEQRRLSALQLQVKSGLEQLEQKMAELERRTQAPAPGVAPAPLNPDELPESVKAIMELNPDLGNAISELAAFQASRAVSSAVAPVMTLRDQLEQANKKAQETAMETAYERVTSTVRAAHADAEQITNSEEFQEWLSKQPSFLRNAGIQAIYENTANADAQDIVAILDAYKASKKVVVAPPPAPRATAPVAPVIAPAAIGGPRNGGLALGPLSEAEMANFGAMKNAVAHDPVALVALMRRLEMTLNPGT